MSYLAIVPIIGQGTGEDPFRAGGSDDQEWSGAVLFQPDPTRRDGFAILSTPGPAQAGDRLGDDPRVILSPQVRSKFAGRAGMNLPDTLPLGQLVYHLLMRGSFTSPGIWNPPRPERYRRPDGKVGYRRGVRIMGFGMLYEEALPGIAGPNTVTITDPFDRANDAASLGSSAEGWSWTESGDGKWGINNNLASLLQASGTGIQSYARAEINLDTDNNYARGVLAQNTTILSRSGVACRYDSTLDTFYGFQRKQDNDPNRLSRVVAGALANIATSTVSAGGFYEVRAEGSTILALSGNPPTTLYLSGTDTTITTGRRAGIWGNAHGGNNRATVNNFEAGDLVVGEAPEFAGWGIPL